MGAAQSEEVPMPPAAWALVTLWFGVWDAPRFRGNNMALKPETVRPLLKLAASCATVLQGHVEGGGSDALPPHGASRELLVAALDQSEAGTALADLVGDPQGFVCDLTKACFKNGDNEFVDRLPEQHLDALLRDKCEVALNQASLLRSNPSSILQSALEAATAKVQALAAAPPVPGDLESVANRLLLASNLQRVAEEADHLLAIPAMKAEEGRLDESFQRSESVVGSGSPKSPALQPPIQRTKSQMAASVKVQKVKQHVDDAASPVHELSRTVSFLAKHDVNDTDELQALRAELEAVDQARKRARNFGEDLVQDMLALDGLSNLTQGDRNMRKVSIQGIESLLQDVDAAKGRLGMLHMSLQSKLAAAEAAQARKAEQSKLAPPNRAAVRGTERHVIEAPPPTKKDWCLLRLPLPFHSQEEPAAYQITATVPGLDPEELKLELSEDKTKLTVRGLRVPTSDEAMQLQGKIAKRIAHLVQQSPDYLTSVHGNIDQIAKDAYMELGQDSFGRFVESFLVPGDANGEGIDASYRDGVLRIMVPKRTQVSRPPFGTGGFGGAGRFSGGLPRGTPSGRQGGMPAVVPRGRPGGVQDGTTRRPFGCAPSQKLGRQGLFGGLDNSYFW